MRAQNEFWQNVQSKAFSETYVDTLVYTFNFSSLQKCAINTVILHAPGANNFHWLILLSKGNSNKSGYHFYQLGISLAFNATSVKNKK